MKSACRRGAPLLVALLLGGCAAASKPLALAPEVDLQRMTGGWYIVAAIPNHFERNLVGMYDYYSLLPDGSIREDFFTYEMSFATKQKHFTVHDTISPGTHHASWHVHFFGPISAPFPLLYVSPRYEYALFGYPNRQLGWIYSRQPRIEEKTYQSLLQRFAEEGYDPKRFRRIVQFPSQLGQPGFTSPPK
jgi:apolipoprotein D and lipocalin family protein